ncbi:site-specific integrase [Fructilactobacillus lindneri]|nr:hypothetical protein [Fructilactobacillus lindneri]SKA06995.1 hypothetical protein SAMN02746042_01388 [Fructilactobacillus lindneri DSM 20690 = JCM 11027]
MARIKRSIMYDVQPLRTKAEIKQVGNLLKQNRYGQRDYMIFYMGINTGLRMSDITSFKIKDVANGKNPTVLELKTRKKEKLIWLISDQNWMLISPIYVHKVLQQKITIGSFHHKNKPKLIIR